MAAISSDLNNALRAEKAWVEVARGLGKVLLGYAALIAGWLVAAAFLYSCYAPILNRKPLKIEHMWYFYIGLAVLKITGLLSWGLILAGQWRCLMSSSERKGAKWVIFFCMTCVVMGPVLHMLAWFGGLSSTPIHRWGGPQAMQSATFSVLGKYLMCASLITSGLYKISFWYYLHTVASCMGASKAKLFVTGFILAVVGMAGFTCWWWLGHLHVNLFNDLQLWIAVGWVSVSVYWVVMIVVVKVAIEQSMAEVHNPMHEKVYRPQYELASS